MATIGDCLETGYGPGVAFAFKDLELDTDTVELRRGGVRVPMELQVFEVLSYLVTHRERVMAKKS